jgi:hypothetical protein
MIVNITPKKGISYVTNSSGKRTALMLDLKNKVIRELAEDLLDNLAIIERQNETSRPFEEIDSEILAKIARKNG